jgi:translation initiation factor IF-2
MNEKTLELHDPVVLKELASAVGQKPFRIVADVMELGQMKFVGDPVDFKTAAKIAKKYGFVAKRA